MEIVSIKSVDFVQSSFFGDTINTTYSKLHKVLGDSSGSDLVKTNYNWDLEGLFTDNDCYLQTIRFTVYDWKEYRKFGDDEEINWHIGSINKSDSKIAKQFLETLLKSYE